MKLVNIGMKLVNIMSILAQGKQISLLSKLLREAFMGMKRQPLHFFQHQLVTASGQFPPSSSDISTNSNISKNLLSTFSRENSAAAVMTHDQREHTSSACRTRKVGTDQLTSELKRRLSQDKIWQSWAVDNEFKVTARTPCADRRDL